MADRPSTVQMAVTSENKDLKSTMPREDLDYRASSSSPKSVIDGIPRKKGTFKITSVKLNDTGDADSMDDLDESHTELTEDYSSELLDASRATDYEQETPSAVEDIPLNNQLQGVRDVKEKSDMHSRFRVVKIETKEPFRRGRWICHDFLDPQPSVNIDKSDTKINQDDTNSGSSSAGSSIHYIYGVDDPTKNPLLAGATGTVYTLIPEGQIAGGQESFQPIHPAPNTAVNQPSNNPQNQATSKGFTSDASQGNSSMCQTVNKSHSQQSISSIASADTINIVSSGQKPMQGDIKTVHHSGQVIGGHTHSQIDCSNKGNVQNTGMFMPHYSSGPGPVQGTSMSVQSVFPPTHSQSTIKSTDNNSSTGSNIQMPNQGQSSTFQTYVHLGQQIPNPIVSQSGQSETRPSSEVQPTGNVKQPLTEGSNPNDVPAELSETDFRSGAADNLYGALDKDLNVIQNPEALSPALVAAVGDLQSPTEEDKRFVLIFTTLSLIGILYCIGCLYVTL
jgi:hypothetical protein